MASQWTDYEIEQAIQAAWSEHGEQYSYLMVRGLCRNMAKDLRARIAELEGQMDALDIAYFAGYHDAKDKYAAKEVA